MKPRLFSFPFTWLATFLLLVVLLGGLYGAAALSHTNATSDRGPVQVDRWNVIAVGTNIFN